MIMLLIQNHARLTQDIPIIIKVNSPTIVQDVKQKPLSEVAKIDFLDDGTPIVYIKKGSLQGIIIEDSKMLKTDKAIKIELGKSTL
jgi:hypothetical protein